MIEIKGKVQLKGYSSICTDDVNENCDKKNLTCCSNVPNIRINGVELHEFLCDAFGVDESPGDYPDDDIKNKALSIRYIVLDKEPTDPYEDFEDLAAKVIIAKFDGSVNTEYTSGCYSEYTCGYGGWDFAMTGEFSVDGTDGTYRSGHNIFIELLGHIDQWIYIKFN